MPPRADEAGDGGKRGIARTVFHRLDGEALESQIERVEPGVGRIEQVGDDVGDATRREARPRPADGLLDDVEAGRPVAGGGDRFGVVAEPASDVDRRAALSGIATKPLDEFGLGREIGPGDRRGIVGCRVVDGVKPAGPVGNPVLDRRDSPVGGVAPFGEIGACGLKRPPGAGAHPFFSHRPRSDCCQ